MQPLTTNELNIMLQNLDKKVDEKFSDIKEILERIEAQTMKTNGRVTALEEKENKRDGSWTTLKWILGFIGFGTLLLVAKHLIHLFI